MSEEIRNININTSAFNSMLNEKISANRGHDTGDNKKMFEAFLNELVVEPDEQK